MSEVEKPAEHGITLHGRWILLAQKLADRFLVRAKLYDVEFGVRCDTRAPQNREVKQVDSCTIQAAHLEELHVDRIGDDFGLIPSLGEIAFVAAAEKLLALSTQEPLARPLLNVTRAAAVK